MLDVHSEQIGFALRRSTRLRKCDRCGGHIVPGEKYERHVWKIDKRVTVYYSHVACHDEEVKRRIRDE